MRDVSAKNTSLRTARARAVLTALPETIRTVRDGRVPKGDPLPVAKVAAIQAVKNTPQLIPYCHTVPIDFVDVQFEIGETEIAVEVFVKGVYKTGVEMEAMAGAMVAALNLYDMLKMIDETMEVRSVTLLDKTGGKSNFARTDGWTCGVVVVSDSVSKGERKDESGALLRERLTAEGGEVVHLEVVPDESWEIRSIVEKWCAEGIDLIMLTGGTGLGPRDTTPEALHGLFTRDLPGVEEQLRDYGQARTPFAMLSRARAGVVVNTVVVALPGSVGAVTDAMDALFPYLTHAFDILAGGGH